MSMAVWRETPCMFLKHVLFNSFSLLVSRIPSIVKADKKESLIVRAHGCGTYAGVIWMAQFLLCKGISWQWGPVPRPSMQKSVCKLPAQYYQSGLLSGRGILGCIGFVEGCSKGQALSSTNIYMYAGVGHPLDYRLHFERAHSVGKPLGKKPNWTCVPSKYLTILCRLGSTT